MHLNSLSNIVAPHVDLQKKPFDQQNHYLKSEEEFLQFFVNVVGSKWPSLASSLPLSVDEIVSVKEEGLSQQDCTLKIAASADSSDGVIVSPLGKRTMQLPHFNHHILYLVLMPAPSADQVMNGSSDLGEQFLSPKIPLVSEMQCSKSPLVSNVQPFPERYLVSAVRTSDWCLISDTQPSERHLVSDVQPIRKVPLVSDVQPIKKVPLVSDVQPTKRVPLVSDVQPTKKVPLVSDVQPTKKVPLVSDVQPTKKVPLVSDVQPTKKVPLVSDAQPIQKVPLVSDVQPIQKVPLVSDVQPIQKVPLVSDVHTSDVSALQPLESPIVFEQQPSEKHHVSDMQYCGQLTGEEVFAQLKKTRASCYLVHYSVDLSKYVLSVIKHEESFDKETPANLSTSDEDKWCSAHFSSFKPKIIPSLLLKRIKDLREDGFTYQAPRDDITPHFTSIIQRFPSVLCDILEYYRHFTEYVVPILYCLQVYQSVYLLFLNAVCTDLARLVHHLCLLMLMAGDIETNPGPTGK